MKVCVDGWWMLAITINCVQVRHFDMGGNGDPRCTYFIQSSYVFDVGDDFETGRRVQAAGWLVEEQDLRARDQLACHADSALLSAADALADCCPDYGILLLAEAERVDEVSDPLNAFFLG